MGAAGYQLKITMIIDEITTHTCGFVYVQVLMTTLSFGVVPFGIANRSRGSFHPLLLQSLQSRENNQI